MSKAVTRLLRRDQTVHWDIDGAIQYNDIIEECRKKKVDGNSQWSLEKNGYQLWQKEEELRKGFNIAWIQTLPINSCTFEQFKEIQEKMLLILRQEWKASKEEDKPCSSLQWIRWRMNVVWEELHAIWQNQESLHTRKLVNVFNIRFFGAIWSSLKREACIFTKTRSHAVVLHNTLPATGIEKAVCMKTQDELCQKVRSTPRVPRVVLKSKSQHGQQDPESQDARSSWDPSCDSNSHGETCNNSVDNRIAGVPLSAVEQQNTTRPRSWSRSLRTTSTRNPSFRTWARRRRTERTFLQTAMSWLQCLLGNRIVYCSCWRNMKSSQRPTECEQNNYDVTSIPGYVIKKNSSRAAKHGPSGRQRVHYQAKQMLKKARQQKHGRHPTILSRWYASESYRNSLYVIGWREKRIMLFDRIVLEKHIYVATKAERIQNSKHWFLTINAEGPQQPLNQRPDFAQAKIECKRLHDEHLARTQQAHRTIPRSQQVRQREGQQFEANEEYDYAVDPKTGRRFYKGSQENLPTASSSSSHWDRTHWKMRSWNSKHSSWSDDLWFFSELGPVSVAWRWTSRQPTGGCEQYTHKYSTYRVALHDHISSREHAWLKSWEAQDCTSSCL